MFIFKHFAHRRGDLAAWLLSLAAFATAGFSLTAWYAVEHARVLSAENERLAALSKVLVEDVSVNLNAIDQALAGLIRDHLAGQPTPDLAAVGRRLRALDEAMPGLRGIVVVDRAGIVLASIPADLTGRDFSQRAYFTVYRQQPDHGLLYLSPPFRSVRGDIVVSASRVLTASGSFQGVVSAVLDPRYFSSILHTALYASDMRAELMHGSGARFVAAGSSAAASTAMLTARSTIALAALRNDSVLTLQLQRSAGVVTGPLRRQAHTFASLYAVLVLSWSAALAWSQSRRRRFERSEAERHRARAQAAALGASEARFRTLIEEAPVAVAMARQGCIIYSNRRYNLLHGYAAEQDLSGLSRRSMITPASLAGLQEQLASLDVDAAVEQRFEAVAVGNGGAAIPVFKATARVALSDGPATLIFVQDISAQKTAEGHLLEARDAAEAANRSKAEFLANMSHEIRTPLNAILGIAYLLERGNRDREAAAMLQKIRISGRSLLGIINDILDVSKIEAGAMQIERSWFALQDVIDTVAATMGVAVADKPITLLVTPLPAGAARALGDALRLEQVLVNLTSNAIKFTERGSVSLSVEARPLADGEAELVFRVADTGIGIAAEQQQRIFSPFTQADTSTTRRYGGSGLGLTICKQIVDLMGGRIGMHSTPGRGSTFWFALTLPLRPASDGAAAPNMHGLEVLVVEAGEPGRSALVDTAQALGWQVHRVGSGAAALAEIGRRGARQLPGAVIIDWQLGGAGCLAAAQDLRDAVPADCCPIVIQLSAYQASAVEAAHTRELADALLTTPVTTSTLYNAVLEARHRRMAPAQAVAPRQAGSSLSGLRLLVVDDSEINRDVAQSILEYEGAQVMLAEHGRAAIDWLLAHPNAIDLVLMDVQMPVMDGIEATTILRSMAQFAELPIVALTAGAFSSHQDAARAAGMNHFIAKPFDVAATVSLIARLTGQRGGSDVLLASPVTPALPAPLRAAAPIDVRMGLDTWGERATFQQYLRKFARDFAGAAASLGVQLRAGERTAAAAAAHKLGGAAGSVALPLVSALALRLERQLSEAQDGSATLAELAAALTAALDEIALLAPPAEAQALAALAPHLQPTQLAPIRACIDDFDWAGAIRLSRALAEQSSAPHQGEL